MKFRNKSTRYGVWASVGIGMLMLASPVSAKVAGQCAICHTMHNSQGGAPMALDAAGAAQATPNDVLLLRGCVACHTGTNTGTNVIPYVNNTSAPNYGTDGTAGDTLAGGTFYWVASGNAGNSAATADSTGHNVDTDDMASQDATLLNVPPGAPGKVALTAQLRCAGVNGCHGDLSATSDFAAIKGTHHGDDTTIDGSTVIKSYRFLDGVTGIEDSDWEFQPTASAHNVYNGVDRTLDTTNDTKTISSLCASCHDEFHNGSGNVGGTNGTPTFSSPWVRHPTDFDMGNTGATTEYRQYGGGTSYVVSAPVARDLTALGEAADISVVTFNDDTIVTCISCHRAHGSQNADILRWDYTDVVAGGTVGGACFECHTTKR